MSHKQFFAALGFAFVAAWVGFGFGYAILCLVGAGLFYAIGSFAQGEFDLTDVQDRLRGSSGPNSYAPPPQPVRSRRVR
jgi:fatty acid desaturase